MTKYIDAEKLIALLEQRKKQLAKWTDKEYANQRIDEIDCILDVDIDSLQQEQPEVDLEKEIDACWRNWLSPSNQKEVEGILPKTEFAMYAHHFWNKGYNARKEK